MSPTEQSGYRFGDVDALLTRARAARREGVEPVQLRIFLGHAKWSREQLLGEIARGSWAIVGEVRDEDLRFHPRMWRSLQDQGRLRWASPNPMQEEHRQRIQSGYS